MHANSDPASRAGDGAGKKTEVSYGRTDRGELLPTQNLRTLDDGLGQLSTQSIALPNVPGYEIQGVLREGGMGIVYKAWQIQVGRVVALKMLPAEKKAAPRNRGRFKREAHTVGQLQHPNIVQLYEQGEADGRPFFSMEYLEGGSLSDRFRDRPQPPQQAAQLVQVLAETIHFAHQRNFIHRDLKPSNILLTQRRLEDSRFRPSDRQQRQRNTTRHGRVGDARHLLLDAEDRRFWPGQAARRRFGSDSNDRRDWHA